MKYAIAVMLGAVIAEQEGQTFQLGESSEDQKPDKQTQKSWEKGDNFGREFGVYKDCDNDECKTGRVEEIKKVSNYLYYSLDTWGQENPASAQPQCNTDEACGGLGANSINKCCASISISEKWSNKENYYIYRCMDRTLVQTSLNFNLEDNLAVNVKCQNESAKSATKIMAGLSAAAVIAATVF